MRWRLPELCRVFRTIFPAKNCGRPRFENTTDNRRFAREGLWRDPAFRSPPRFLEGVLARQRFVESDQILFLARSKAPQPCETRIVSDLSTLLKRPNVATNGTSCRTTKPVEDSSIGLEISFGEKDTWLSEQHNQNPSTSSV
jgi:hypothetical protein